MTISAQIIADSISPTGQRITTMQLRYPRFIHAEFMTHRVFSRNASSSRAIPVERMIEDLRRDLAMPVYWGSNKPGMQAGAELNEGDRQQAEHNWLNAMNFMINYAQRLIDIGLHKQIANRILEPWAHINVVVTATEWDNFYELRCHKDAQPEIRLLAEAMREAQNQSQPTLLQPGEWHLPYVTKEERQDAYFGPSQTPSWNELIQVSVARCARVSYRTHDGRKTTVEEDIKLYERLVGGVPLHASPAEHQATPDNWSDLGQASYDGPPSMCGKYNRPALHGNFSGWIQFRKQLEQKFVS